MENVAMIEPERAAHKQRAAAAYEVDCRVAAQIDPADSVFMCGFWRSGTTWLQETLVQSLHAKLVFEPLYYPVPDMQAIYAHEQLQDKDKRFLHVFMPYCEGRLEGHPLYDFFARALRSTLPGRWVRIYRRELAESERTRIVLKCVRSQLCLRAVQNTFGMPVICIHRDPRAVLASLRTIHWFKFFKKISLRKQLLKPADGRAEFFGRWRDEIMHYDQQDVVSRVAAYWALTEKFVQHSYADNRARAVFVSYEDLCRRREKLLAEIFQQLGVRSAAEDVLQALDNDSSSTVQQRRGASVTERLSGWRNVLSSDESEAIAGIATHFGFADRLVA